MMFLKELWRRLWGKSLTGIGTKPKYTIIYEGDERDNRSIPYIPPVGSRITAITKDGFTIENATDKKITYKVIVGPFSKSFLPKTWTLEQMQSSEKTGEKR